MTRKGKAIFYSHIHRYINIFGFTDKYLAVAISIHFPVVPNSRTNRFDMKKKISLGRVSVRKLVCCVWLLVLAKNI